MDEQLQQILQEQLRDVHLPEAISWWPLSVGWWILILLILFVLGAIIFRTIQHLKHNRYRKLAARELQLHFNTWQDDRDSSAYIHGANELLKRCVISFKPATAKLSGKAWADTLDLHANSVLSQKTKLALTESIYQAKPTIDVSAVHKELTHWIKRHQQEVPNV